MYAASREKFGLNFFLKLRSHQGGIAQWPTLKYTAGLVGYYGTDTIDVKCNVQKSVLMMFQLKRHDRLVMVALCNRADHYIFILFLSSFFLLSFFFFLA